MYFNKHIRLVGLLAILVVLSSGSMVSAKTIYKWTDANGQIHITDDPPAPGKAVRIDRIEYKERDSGDAVAKSESSVSHFLDKLGRVLDSYGYEKTAQIRYLKQVSFTRYVALTMNDFIGPECDLMSGMQNVVGSSGSIVLLSVLFLLHIFLAICFYRIILKISSVRVKLAFVPVLNIFSLIDATGKPVWWGLLLIVPFAVFFPPFVIVNINIQLLFAAAFFVGIILFTIVWVSICKRLEFRWWAGLLILVPFVQLVLPAYLAFKKNDQPDRGTRIESATRELYFHLLSSKKISFETGSMSTSQGPVAVKLEQGRKNKNYPNLKLRVRLVHLPNFVLESKRFCKFAIKEVLSVQGENVYYREHPLEKKAGNELHFKEIMSPFIHFESVRDVWLSKEISMKDILSVSGELFLRLPLNIQSINFNRNDLQQEGYTNTARVLLKDLRNNSGSFLFRGPIQNYVTTCAYGSSGQPLLHKTRSIDKIDSKNYSVKENFKGKIARLKIFIADNYLEQRYPFEIKL